VPLEVGCTETRVKVATPGAVAGRTRMAPAGRPSTVAYTPPVRRRLSRTEATVSASAVDGGSSCGRAPKAAWMTSTIPAASDSEATETTRSRTETLTAAYRNVGGPADRRRAVGGATRCR
jgi:hypothetical protein